MSAVGSEATLGREVAVASLRERKNRATRATLRHSAVTLIASRGLASVTVEDIAAHADVSPRTFYNYFPSKEDAVSGWDPGMVSDLVARLRGRPAGEAAPAALQAALSEVFSLFDDDHRDWLERLRLTRSDPHLLAHHVARWGEAEHQLVSALAERRGSDAAHDSYAALVVATTLAASRVAMMSWCEDEGHISLAQELAFNLEILGSGLAEPDRSIP